MPLGRLATAAARVSVIGDDVRRSARGVRLDNVAHASRSAWPPWSSVLLRLVGERAVRRSRPREVTPRHCRLTESRLRHILSTARDWGCLAGPARTSRPTATRRTATPDRRQGPPAGEPPLRRRTRGLKIVVPRVDVALKVACVRSGVGWPSRSATGVGLGTKANQTPSSSVMLAAVRLAVHCLDPVGELPPTTCRRRW